MYSHDVLLSPSLLQVCTSVGLTVNQKLVAGSLSSNTRLTLLHHVHCPGVVHCPVLGLCYTAVKGRGSFCNGRRVKVSGTKDLAKVAVDRGFSDLSTLPSGHGHHGAAGRGQLGEKEDGP